MKQRQGTLRVRARGQGLHEITASVGEWLAEEKLDSGLLTLFLRHTSASLLVQENADSDVRHDLEAFLQRLAPEDTRLYRHIAEGPDDMPAHIKAALTQTQISIPVLSGRLGLGRYQGIYLFEHRRRPQERELLLHYLGE